MPTVLVVDDDAGIRESAAMALEKVGLKTVQAADVTSALQALRAHRIDLVLSDIYMPGENGIELLQAVAERRDAPRVILMTARGSIETTALAQRAGAFDYLAKPFELSELIARVAATTRTETRWLFSAPSGVTVPSCRKRSSLTWKAGEMSPISSRKSVPPSARERAPRRS